MDTPKIPSPSKLCLSGAHSWGVCSGGDFLCQVAFGAIQEQCLRLKAQKDGFRFDSAAWFGNDCDVLTSGTLSAVAYDRLVSLTNASLDHDSTSLSTSLQRKVHIVSVYSEPADTYNMVWMCSALAARLAHGYVFHEIIVRQFTFAEKPRQLLKLITSSTFEPDAIVWFQDAFDVLMVAGDRELPAVLMDSMREDDVLFNGECNCFPKLDHLCQEQDRLFGAEGPHRYLNSGQFIGRASTIERLLRGVMRMIDEAGGDWPTTDQGAFAEFCFGNGRHRASRVGVRCVLDSSAKVMRTMIRCDGTQPFSAISRPLDIPADFGECIGQTDQRCLKDPETSHQATSLHFNGKGPMHHLEISKAKSFITYALERSSQLHANLSGCSYVQVGHLYLGCIEYSQRCSKILENEFSMPGRPAERLDTFETVCMRDDAVYFCGPPYTQNVTTIASESSRPAQQLHGSTPHNESSLTKEKSALGISLNKNWVCNDKRGWWYRCAGKKLSSDPDYRSNFLCSEGTMLCDCGRSPMPRLDLDHAKRFLGCRPEKYIDEARRLLQSRFGLQGSHRVTEGLLSSFMATSPSRRYCVRITVVDGLLYVSNLAEVADRPRALAVVREMLAVLDFAKVPDLDFIFHFGDGVPDAWPLEKPHVQYPMYAPVFVHEMWHGAGAILAPPRSHTEGNLMAMSPESVRALWTSKRAKAVWRGSTTGAVYTKDNWQVPPRSKAVLLSRKRPDLLDAGFNNLNAQAEGPAADLMEKAGMGANRMQYDELFRHQIVLSIDGNTVADRLPTLLAGASAVVKQGSERIEFWYHDLVPFVHYIPAHADLSDLEHVLDEALRNSTRLQQIGQNGRALVLDRLHPHSILCYWMQLLHTYSDFLEQPIRVPSNSRRVDPFKEWELLL